MPSTRARTSAVRVAGTRPGSSTTLGIGCDLTVMTSTSGGGGAGVGLSEHPANMSRAAPSAALRRLLKYLAECIDILPDTELTYNALQRLRDGQVAAVPCRTILRQLQVSQPQNATSHIQERNFKKKKK